MCDVAVESGSTMVRRGGSNRGENSPLLQKIAIDLDCMMRKSERRDAKKLWIGDWAPVAQRPSLPHLFCAQAPAPGRRLSSSFPIAACKLHMQNSPTKIHYNVHLHRIFKCNIRADYVFAPQFSTVPTLFETVFQHAISLFRPSNHMSSTHERILSSHAGSNLTVPIARLGCNDCL
jgi:hypothetical protein